MSAPEPEPHATAATLCQRCGTEMTLDGNEAATCRICLPGDLSRGDLAEWFAPLERPGLRASDAFTLLEEIGRGGMGQVFRARQHSPEREVAVKLLLPHLLSSEETRRRFLAEAAAMAELEHPGLLPLYACGETDGRPWLATRLASGGNLAQRREHYAGKWREIASLTLALAEAIEHAHARGIIHRDLKPSNVLFDSAGSAAIADFGLAKWRDELGGGQTLSLAVMGTPAYMAPETARLGARAATTAADVYGLGAILYELITGRPPYDGSSPSEVLMKLATAGAPRPRSVQPGIPRDLEVICQHAIASEPAGRYPSAGALAADLRRFLAGEPVAARPCSVPERALRWARRRPLAASLTGALAAVLAVSAAVIVRKNAALSQTNAELATASAGWQVAADDAEQGVAYAVETLPGILAPLGKLSLLDGLFQEVAAHYVRARTSPARDRSTVEVREATFLIQWSLVLRPLGRIPEAEARLREAEVIAASVTSRPAAPPRAWALLARARQLSGLLAALKDRTEEARQLYDASIAATAQGLERFPSHPELLVARAEAIAERCDGLIAGEGGEPAALDALEAAWREAIRASQNAAPDVLQAHLRELAKVIYYRGRAAEERADWPRAEQHFRALLTENERLAALPAATDEDRQNVAAACNRTARALAAQPFTAAAREEFETLAARQHRIMDGLMQNDPHNLRWRASAGLMALQEALPHIKASEHEQAIKTLRKASALVQDIPDEVSSGLPGGRCSILNAIAEQLARQAGKLSQAVRQAAAGESAAARARASAAADEAFTAALAAFPSPKNNVPRRAFAAALQIWHQHGPPGHARSQIEQTTAGASCSAELAAVLNSLLKEVETASAAAAGITNSP